MGSKPVHVKLREKRNRPPEGEPFVWFTRELLESDAWRTAPINTRRFVERLILEHMAHAGSENGNLVCTFDDCVAWGILRKYVREAQADAIRRGLVYQSVQGKASPGAGRRPSVFGIGWLPRHDGGAAPNRWKVQGSTAPDTRQSLKGSSHLGTKSNGGIQPKPPIAPPNKVPKRALEIVPKRALENTLPPGWKYGKDSDGHVRALCPGPSPKRPWVGVPLIDGAGDEFEQRARRELQAWQNG